MVPDLDAVALKPHADVFALTKISRSSPRPAWARVDQILVGEFSRAPNTDYMRRHSGGQLLPRTKAHLIWSPRRFVNDIQEWEWIERRFDARQRVRVAALDRGAAAGRQSTLVIFE